MLKITLIGKTIETQIIAAGTAAYWIAKYQARGYRVTVNSAVN